MSEMNAILHPAPTTMAAPEAFASRLVIWVFCLTQFADISFGQIGNLPLTLQKLLGLCAYPVALVLLGRAPAGGSLRHFALALGACYSIAGLVRSTAAGGILSADFGVLTGLFSAWLLYRALNDRPEAFDEFLRVWTWLGIATSIIGILQVAELLPTVPAIDKDADFALMADGVRRGWGLKADANFQALMLVIALVTARLAPLRHRWLAITVIAAGLVATFSRMGLVLGAVALLVAGLALRPGTGRRGVARHILRYLAVLLVMVGLVAGALMMGVSEAAERYLGRLGESVSVIDLLAEGEVADRQDRNLNSTEARTALLLGSVEIAAQHMPFGVGPYQSEGLMYELVGLYNVAHNVYLEWLMIGGVAGLLPPAVFLISVRRARQAARPLTDRRPAALLLAVAVVFAIAGLFLSLTYNSFIWLPLALADWLRLKAQTTAEG